MAENIIYNFTTCGATGREGCTQSQVDSAYTSTPLEDKIVINAQGIQEWIVPSSGIYRIECAGAKGGHSTTDEEGVNIESLGGKGAYMSGEFNLKAGKKIKILVGQMGGIGKDANAGGGGGGFVWLDLNNELLIASGGGGGGGAGLNSILLTGLDGTKETNGTKGVGLDNETKILSCGNEGQNGNGGSAGGAGWLTNGFTDNSRFNNLNTVAYRPLEGGMGSERNSSSANIDYNTRNGEGGFGGGSSACGRFSFSGAGGGGGYSGGAGQVAQAIGKDLGGGGGGGSYNVGENQENQSGFNDGDGYIIITYQGVSTNDKYLIKDNDVNDYKAYDETTNSWTSVGTELTEEILNTKGMDIPNLDKLGLLNITSTPQLLAYSLNISVVDKQVVVKALPLPQIVKQLPTIDMANKVITNITIDDTVVVSEGGSSELTQPTGEYIEGSKVDKYPDIAEKYIVKFEIGGLFSGLYATECKWILDNDLIHLDREDTSLTVKEYNEDGSFKENIWEGNPDGRYYMSSDNKLVEANYDLLQADGTVHFEQNIGQQSAPVPPIASTINSIIRYLLSVDNGVTWKSYFGDTWVGTDIADKDAFKTKGMTKEIINTLTLKDYREGLQVQDSIKFAFYLESDLMDEVVKINSINISTTDDV